MRRFLALSGTYVGILAIVISLLLSAARMRPFSTPIQRLHLMDCSLPCLAGITVNQTTVEAAEQSLNSNFGRTGYVEDIYETGKNNFHYLSWVGQEENPPKAYSRIQVTFTRGVATSVNLATYALTDDWLPGLADTLLIFGTPTCYWPSAQNDPHVKLIYENQQGAGELIVATDTGLTMASSVQYISLDGRRSGECALLGSAWRGFTSRRSAQP